ncbi:formylglycine-generating enzyme family protein [Catellatospora tritici]|uniref:formylglycine-generating enzyme family protein n=1 Tax=Catellatospora tritici TaxID=2851566 RepID=UPI001C2D37CD|nr:formylglycine-generating enzyme family protein [Catellatospora tritici]MBV1855850.1 formylglycine-generating enzyme family protein [Catellatospora tritici]
MEITWERWTALDNAGSRALADRIAGRVGAASAEVGLHEYAGRRARTAVFDVDGVPFALVPARQVQVGYDVDHFCPTADQVGSYRESAEAFGLPDDIRDYVAERTSPPCTVSVPALLVAVEAVQAGLTAMPVDEPTVLRRVDELRQTVAVTGSAMPEQVEWAGFGRALLASDGSVRAAWMYDTPSYDNEVARLAGLGRRLLTPDEWEYACGAGATTLFRWGDTYPGGGDPWSARIGPHREPSLFGLAIGQDPYRDERTADPAVICGGDGGSMVCGGSGDFVSWLTIATAYRDADYAQFVQDEAEDVDQMLVRPVIPLHN